MGELKGSYKGYDLWYYEKGEKTSQAVWVAVSKGKRPEIPEFKKTKKGLKNLINETINKPPEKIETYNSVDIIFNYKSGKYEAQVDSRTRKSDDVQKLKKWIDKQRK